MTVLGLSVWAANLERLVDAMVDEHVEGRVDAAEEIRDAWVGNIESEGLVETGHYRDSVHVERDGDDVAVLTDVDYGGVLEHGDSRIPAHPVAERAFEEHGEDAIVTVGDRVGGAIR